MFSFDRVPEIVWDERPDLIELYKKAWQLAADHIKTVPGLPVERYMDEACMPDRIWIWDTCFMVHFCKYAPDFFPGIQSLDNFYLPLYDNAKSSCLIQHVDNPPLFAWVEYEYFRFTGDSSRIYRNLVEKRYLQKHYEFLENECRLGGTPEAGFCFTTWQNCGTGYAWTGCPSGMDNTPRGGTLPGALWVDALAQMALSALYIVKLAEAIGESAIADEYRRKYQEKCELLNRLYFDETDGCYYDITMKWHYPIKILTPASFWVLLAEAAPAERAERQIATLLDPEKLGGKVPLPSLSRNDPNFVDNGQYWRGGVWLPTAYMSIKSLEKYGKYDLARKLSLELLDHMSKTFREYTPHTIWECYSPTECTPAASRRKPVCRPDFCGWSALGPISLLIENVLGFHKADALTRTLELNAAAVCGRRGIKNFKFGDVCCDIICENGKLHCRSNRPFTLRVNDKVLDIPAGDTVFPSAY